VISMFSHAISTVSCRDREMVRDGLCLDCCCTHLFSSPDRNLMEAFSSPNRGLVRVLDTVLFCSAHRLSFLAHLRFFGLCSLRWEPNDIWPTIETTLLTQLNKIHGCCCSLPNKKQ